MHTASWVIVEKGSRRVLFETFNRRIAACINTARYEAVPILQYLGSLNAAIRGEVRS